MTITEAQQIYATRLHEAYVEFTGNIIEATKPIPKFPSGTPPDAPYPIIGESVPELARLPDGTLVKPQRVEFPHNFGKPTGEIKGNE